MGVMEDKPEEATKCSSQGVCKVVCAVILLTIGIVVGYNLNGSKAETDSHRHEVIVAGGSFPLMIDHKTGDTWGLQQGVWNKLTRKVDANSSSKSGKRTDDWVFDIEAYQLHIKRLEGYLEREREEEEEARRKKSEAAAKKKPTLLEVFEAEDKKERDAAAKKQGTNQPSTTKK